ncbi:MAG TPA: hypothetical protein VGC45_15905 [Gryllotalpicola sp.]
MPRPRRKPFWRWAPLPWVALLLLMLVTGSLQDLGYAAVYVVGIVVTVLFAAGLVVGLIAAARRRGANFTAEGRLLRLEGLEFTTAPRAGHPITVQDTRRHQFSIELALARGAAPVSALLVPDCGNWWSLRADVGVYLLTDGGFHFAGRLGDQAQVSWQGLLDGLRAAGRYAVVPAEVVNASRPYAIDVRLEGLKGLEELRDLEVTA